MKPSDLGRALAGGAIRPVYLLYGEEPLQKTELHDALLNRARQDGYAEREVLEAGRGFDWAALAQAADSLSLFADKRIIELRLGSSGPGRDGSAALVAYAADPPPDTLLIVLAGALDWRATRSAWFQALARVGAAVECAAPPLPRLPDWVRERMLGAGLQPTEAAVQLVCERVEGNLLAADQQIKTLALLNGPGEVDEVAVLAAVANSARYNPYDLGQAALAGDADRCARMIQGLKDEGVAPNLVHWVIRNDTRTLLALSLRCGRGESLAQAFSALKVAKRRQPELRAAMNRLRPAALAVMLVQLARLERSIKGMDRELGESRDSHWLLLLELTFRLAGAQLPRRLGFP